MDGDIIAQFTISEAQLPVTLLGQPGTATPTDSKPGAGTAGSPGRPTSGSGGKGAS